MREATTHPWSVAAEVRVLIRCFGSDVKREIARWDHVLARFVNTMRLSKVNFGGQLVLLRVLILTVGDAIH